MRLRSKVSSTNVYGPGTRFRKSRTEIQSIDRNMEGQNLIYRTTLQKTLVMMSLFQTVSGKNKSGKHRFSES